MKEKKKVGLIDCEQGSLIWHRARLGIITSSKIGDLIGMLKRDKDGKWIAPKIAKTGMSYLYKKAAERGLREDLVNDDELFTQYLEEEQYTSKAMKLGTVNEDLARWIYQKRTGNIVTQIGLQKYYDIFADSPDGLVLMDRSLGSIEIKCPTGGYHCLYSQMETQEDLLAINQDYYIQCQCHIVANEAEWCDFISFNGTQNHDMHVVRIYPDAEVKEIILGVINEANEIISGLVKK